MTPFLFFFFTALSVFGALAVVVNKNPVNGALSLLVMCSDHEGLPIALLEAMWLGVPVVSTAVMGTADVLANARGALVAPDEIEGYARSIVQVLRDAGLRGALSAAAPHDAAAWSAGAMATRLAALYAELAATARASGYSSPPATARA